jgi:hypothetical protein
MEPPGIDSINFTTNGVFVDAPKFNDGEYGSRTGAEIACFENGRSSAEELNGEVWD